MIGPSLVLNAGLDHTSRLHRFCTPSILPAIDLMVGSPSRHEASVSDDRYGSHLDASGLLGGAARDVACAHGADRCVILDGGSTEGNRILVRYLACQEREPMVLISRNAHHSVMNALLVNNVDFRYLPVPPYSERFEALLPPSLEEITSGLERHPEATAVFITSPTYEGLHADVPRIANALRRSHPHLLLLVDEAWGAHIRFDPDCGLSAMSAGADACVQSTHKLGGSMQGGAVLLWRDARIDCEAMMAAYAESVSTSPNFTVLGSVHAATRILSGGRHHVTNAAARASEIAGLLAEIAGVDVLRTVAEVDSDGEHVARLDPLKVQASLVGWRASGFEVKDALLSAGIVPEKAGLRTVLFLSTFQQSPGAPDALASALAACLSGRELSQVTAPKSSGNPFAVGDIDPVLPPGYVRRIAAQSSTIVPMSDAVGLVAAEAVELYPPGIPIVRPGWRVSVDEVELLRDSARSGARVIARDPSLGSLRVLQPALRRVA